MTITLENLLFKMGLKELATQKTMRWEYTDVDNSQYGGYAQARLENNDQNLIVDLQHRLKDFENDDGEYETDHQESVKLRAECIGDTNEYRVTELSFDGISHDPENIAMVELCAGIFYARAVHIHELMLDSKFKTAVSSHFDDKRHVEKPQITTSSDMTETPVSMGVVVPFPGSKFAAA